MDELENTNHEESPEEVKAQADPETAKEIVNNFVQNGVTKEELKAVLMEMFPEKQESTEEIVNKYVLSLKGDGLQGR